MPDKIKVGLMTHAGGAHVGAYLTALAATEECESVVLADPDGRFKADAQQALGDKMKGFYTSFREMLAAEKPEMALITIEPRYRSGPGRQLPCLCRETCLRGDS